jgi:hypothetical protein
MQKLGLSKSSLFLQPGPIQQLLLQAYLKFLALDFSLLGFCS